MCTQNSCINELQGCFQTPGCADFNQQTPDWLSCVTTCGQQNPTPQCYTACDTQFANASAGWQPIYTCMCNSCINECGAIVDPCNH